MPQPRLRSPPPRRRGRGAPSSRPGTRGGAGWPSPRPRPRTRPPIRPRTRTRPRIFFALVLVLELALAEQPADDAAEVELLAFVFVFELELTKCAVLRSARGHDVLSFLAWRASAVAVGATAVRMPVRAPGVAARRCRGTADSASCPRVALERGGSAPGAAEHSACPAAHHLSGHAAVDRAAGGCAPGQVACRALDDGRHRSDGRPRSAPPPQDAGEHAGRAHQVGQQAAQLSAVPCGQHGHGSRADHGLGFGLGLGPGGYRGHHLRHRLGLAHRVGCLVSRTRPRRGARR